MKWLVTAFEPFGGSAVNASLDVLSALREHPAASWRDQVSFHAPVPVTFSGAWPSVEAALAGDTKPFDGVLALGQAGGRSRLNLERLALNWTESKSPDNSGLLAPAGKIEPGGPDLLWCPIPWTRFHPARPELFETSFSAGTYVCNHLMFHTLRWAVRENKLGGFLHIPEASVLPLNDAVIGISDVLEFLVGLKAGERLQC